MTYTTIQGDTWDGIAFKVYGKELLMPTLLRANPAYAEKSVLDGGIVLITPPAPVEYNSTLPPWKRGDSL